MKETPPRMRGRLAVNLNRHVRLGNTPAYAGKTRAESVRVPAPQKHPRVCGEDSPTRPSFSGSLETPPRMRGRPAARLSLRHLCRNTPAYAGKTMFLPWYSDIARKHPRVCGEDCVCAPAAAMLRETPPRMRGRLYMREPAYPPSGNTPAYAGKTVPPAPPRPYRRKHPRVCGEDPHRSRCRLLLPETPPRMRGRRPPDWTNWSRWKHPRVCGEDASLSEKTGTKRETPPRMRGRLSKR